MKLKKIIPLLTLLTLLTCLTGCKSKDTANNDINEPPKNEAASSDYTRDFGNSVNNFHFPIFVAEYFNSFYYCDSEKPGIFTARNVDELWVKLNDDYASYLNIYQDKMYYINTKTSELVKIDIDGVSNKEVIDTSVSSALIKNNKLIYSKMTPHSNGDGFSSFSLVQLDIKTNKVLSDKIIADRSFSLIDENRYISGSRELFNMLEVNGNVVYPTNQKESMLAVVGATENSVICESSDFSSDKTYLVINNDGTSSNIYFPYPCTYLIADNKVFCSGTDGLSYVDIKTREHKILNNYTTYKLAPIFEFDGIIYTINENCMKAMYNIKDNTFLGDYKDSAITQGTTESNGEDEIEKSKALIIEADSDNITASESNGFELRYIPRLTSENCIELAKSWNIELSGNCYSYELAGEYMKNQYIVEMDTKKVYLIPNQGMMPAYLIENNKKLQTFEYKTN